MAASSNYGGDRMTPYVQSFPYSDKRLFEPPRVQIPPPALDYQHGRPTFRVSSTSFGQMSGIYGDPTFLRALTACYNLNMRHTMLSWQYEMRRTAQAIVPFLFLGPSSAAKDPEFVKRTGITLLVAVRNTTSVRTRPAFLDPALFPSSEGISTLTFDFDSPYDFIPNLRPIVRAMNDHLAATCIRTPPKDVSDIKGKILVFCESGNDRSTVLVAAYLMATFGISAVSAIHIIQSQRFSITTSDEMKNVLLDWQEIVKAERQVAAGQQQASSFVLPQRPVKRNIDHVYDNDDAGLDSQQSGNLEVREGVAPFADVAG
ncbi:hypothetical protein A1O1_00250 [Capronia coronata CBS 617.96]|uniref:Tyrosine specific protein phosphatases domain-containing protein n=1 Tax=Capronia coronata CBS 617.96 TaxID=1182541 RepID=W9Z0N5_9EURO|nr:uncharacterized protein A1O1_00250 [Capronia coronata CBS 617.96]EXJ95131.1 hypothetical protein A1O1_00250 [Capronia coronata CBS 617.96]